MMEHPWPYGLSLGTVSPSETILKHNIYGLLSFVLFPLHQRKCLHETSYAKAQERKKGCLARFGFADSKLSETTVM